MKTPEQLKGTIRSMAAKKNLRAQEVLQMFLFECILERMANSRFKDNFILKGGLLISSMIGITERTTMDMDTTVRGIQMEEDEIVSAVKEIVAIDTQCIRGRAQAVYPCFLLPDSCCPFFGIACKKISFTTRFLYVVQ